MDCPVNSQNFSPTPHLEGFYPVTITCMNSSSLGSMSKYRNDKRIYEIFLIFYIFVSSISCSAHLKYSANFKFPSTTVFN